MEGFYSAVMNETSAAQCLPVLEAAERKDIKVIASRLLPVEIGAYRGDRPGIAAADDLITQYLYSVDAEWSELDIMVAREARRLSWEYDMRAADSIHLATAARRRADYFMTLDQGYPHDTTVEGVAVSGPRIVWTPTLFDGQAIA